MNLNFEIPDSWLQLTVGEIIEYGKADKAEPTEIPNDAWVLELEDIEKDTSKLLERITFGQRQSKSTKNRFRADDVLYGKLRPYLNKVLIADSDGYCTTEILPLRPNQAINGHFLFYWLKHSIFLNYVESVSHGLNMPRLGTDAGKQAPLFLPPLNEQKRIVAEIETLRERSQKARSVLSAIPELCDKFRQSVLAAAFRGDLTADRREQNPDIEPASVLLERIREKREKISKSHAPKKNIPEELTDFASNGSLDLPKEWCLTTAIEACIEVVDCHNKTAPYTDSGIKLIRTSNIRNGVINLNTPDNFKRR